MARLRVRRRARRRAGRRPGRRAPAGAAGCASERFVAFDHAARRAWAVAPGGRVRGVPRGADAADRSAPEARRPPRGTAAAARPPHPAEYAALIERCRDAIREGDAYQLCLTTRFDGRRIRCDPLDAYRAPARGDARPPRRARPRPATSRSPARARSGSSRSTAASCSTRPIKGTRPRGADAGDGCRARGRAAREREGARRERHDRRPHAQRPVAGVRARLGRRRRDCSRWSATPPCTSSSAPCRAASRTGRRSATC